MRFVYLVVLFISIQTYGKYAPYPAFQLLTNDYKKSAPCTEAKNLPPLIDQDGLPICLACVASNIFRQYKCTTESLDCKNLNSDEIPGVLGLAGTLRDHSEALNPIPFSNVPNTKDSPSAIIGNLFFRGGVAPESCFPLDQFVAKYGNRSADIRKVFAKYQEKFNAIQSGTEGEICIECLKKELKIDFGVSPDIEAIRLALKDKDFDGFIGDLVLSGPRCEWKEFQPKPKMEFYPSGLEKPAYSEYMKRIDAVLKENQIAGADVCLSKKNHPLSDVNCQDGHSITLVGKCTFCNGSGKCRDAIHVMNSWGQEWQDENNDGWVDAENLYSYFVTEGVSLSHPKLKK